ncbi:hypothetical protein PL321_13175 [Caloramator sp. mosi_1]|uniref:hypothetical protein n=1 Tax=Caloramator sp. mosi_1 TaxID=3023090 RepID=UPI00235DEAFE|nr:hypothetical protein [Caloramator sp. mosi_1]WDC85932.1 hypothetical protein PL321_13175 [Caloramator sp. mosi_1]
MMYGHFDWFLFETIIFCQFVSENIYNEIIDKFVTGGRIIFVDKLVYVVDRTI